jgi:hypothetical protein
LLQTTSRSSVCCELGCLVVSHLTLTFTYEPETLSTPKFHKHIASSSYVKTVIS